MPSGSSVSVALVLLGELQIKWPESRNKFRFAPGRSQFALFEEVAQPLFLHLEGCSEDAQMDTRDGDTFLICSFMPSSAFQGAC